MNLTMMVVTVATAPIKPVATATGHHIVSRLIFAVSAISLAISAWIFQALRWSCHLSSLPSFRVSGCDVFATSY